MGAIERPIEGYELVDPAEARRRAEELRPACRAWLRRARRLFRDQPPGTKIYFEGESGLCLMALAEDGRSFIRQNGGEDQAAVIESIPVHKSDCGGW